MQIANEIRDTRLAVERLLGEMGVHDFVYTVEQKDGDWTLRIECDTRPEWQVITLRIDPGELCASLTDPSVREKLRGDWAPHLQSCVNAGSRPSTS